MQMTYIDRFNIATELAGSKYGKYSSSYEKDGISLLENGIYSSYCPVDTAFANQLYRALFHNRFHIIDPDDGKKYNRIGYTWVTLKKDKKAEYGYKVVKCSYRMFRQIQ